MTREEFVSNKLFKDNFMIKVRREVCLEEEEKSGRTKLIVQLNSDDNYLIRNPDNNGMSHIGFFRTEKEFSMQKRVDHIVFEREAENQWMIHLIEMKTTVGMKTWQEIKGKFRASLLLAEAVAAMLDFNINKIKMYTTFENVNLKMDPYAPVSRRGNVGRKKTSPEDEWNGRDFTLNLGERILFQHKPVKVERDGEVLLGTVCF